MRASTSKLPIVAESSSHCFKVGLTLLIVSCCFGFACSTGSKPKVEAPPAPIAKAEDSAHPGCKVATT